MSKEQKDKGVIMSKKYDYLVVGAGLYGAVFAHEAKEAGKSVLVIDKRPEYCWKCVYRGCRGNSCA